MRHKEAKFLAQGHTSVVKEIKQINKTLGQRESKFFIAEWSQANVK